MPEEFTNNFKRTEADDETELAMVWRLFKQAVSAIVGFIQRNLALLLTFTVLGSMAGYAVYYFTKPYYATSMTLMVADVPNQVVEEQLHQLSALVADQHYAAVAAALQMPVAAATQLKSITSINLRHQPAYANKNLSMIPLEVTVQLYDKRLISQLDTAIIKYVETNLYFAAQKKIRQQQVERMLAKLNDDIASIDSIKLRHVTPIKPFGEILYEEPLDPSRLYRQSISMYQSKIELETELERLQQIQLAIGFQPQHKPAAPNLVKYLLLGDAAAFILGLLLALWLELAPKRRLA